MGGLVTWEALTSSRSQYTGNSLGLPMEDSSTPPVAACFQISWMASSCQLAFSRRALLFFSIFNAWVGQ